MPNIACLSQKGGVGKSTIARLMARTYARGGWNVKIADFNVKQKTSVDWAALRLSMNVEPGIPAEAYNDVSKALTAGVDMLIFDGKPDSDVQTMRLAQEADLVIIPTGVSGDDLGPQVRFANEMKLRGIAMSKILFVINKATDSPAAIVDAKDFITAAGFQVANNPIQMKTAYINAHNQGRCLAETEFPTLNNRAELVAQEIIDRLNRLLGIPDERPVEAASAS